MNQAVAEELNMATDNGAAEALGQLPGWAVPVIIGAAVLAIALAIVLFVKRSRGKRKAGVTVPIPESGQSEQANDAIFSAKWLPVSSIGNVHGIGDREDQQDAFGVSDLKNQSLVLGKGILAIVADGMGGLHQSGAISHTLVQAGLAEFAGAEGSQREILLSLGAKINGMAIERFGRAATGTTFIAASIHRNQLDFLSIGDSRIALCRAGSLLTLNRVHNYAADLDSSAARGLVSVASALNDPKRARLTSYVGMDDPKAVDLPVSPMTLQKGDRVLMMTDGLFGTLSDEEIVQALEMPAPEAAKRLDGLVREKKKPNQDNYTAIILEI